MNSSDADPRWFARPSARQWRCAAPPVGEAAAFHAGLPGYAPTPLVELPALAGALDVGRLFVKDESWRLGLPAFKALGASWAVARILARRAALDGPLTLEVLRAAAAREPVTLVTATDGNHGRAVARMASLLGLHAQVFVPDVVSRASVAAIESEGAGVTVVRGSYDRAVELAAAAAARPLTVLVQDTAWPGYEEVPQLIVAGYGTMLVEIDRQLAEARAGGADLVVVPVGVGSLAQAVVTHYRRAERAASPALLSVEPDTADCLRQCLMAGQLLSVPTGATIMAGLNCGTPSSLAWPFLRDGLDAAATVSDDDADRAVAQLAELGVSSGPCGAASLAGARFALSGPGSDLRRVSLGITAASTVVLLSTEGRPGPAVPAAVD